ncbi:hypothetical protein RSAG8_08103, partial [Rhizoctonia solani AG-8 WAC10335]
MHASVYILGVEHPDALSSMNNLAWTYTCLGRWDEAEHLLCKAISIAERTLGDQHPVTQTCRKGLTYVQNQRPAHLRDNLPINI